MSVLIVVIVLIYIVNAIIHAKDSGNQKISEIWFDTELEK